MRKRQIVWQHHAFSPLYKDEVHERFDALEDDKGVRVLNVGTWRTAAYARTRDEAVEIAEALAAEWKPKRRLINQRGDLL